MDGMHPNQIFARFEAETTSGRRWKAQEELAQAKGCEPQGDARNVQIAENSTNVITLELTVQRDVVNVRL
jgi:hypothetical protein